MNELVRIPAVRRKSPRWGYLLIGAFLFAPLLDAAAGVLVAPSVVFLSDKARTGRMTIQNPGNTPGEVTIGFSFGLPESDSLGNVRVRLDDSAINDPRSAATWVKAFPRKLIIPPNGSQIVRFVAKPPDTLPDGEYWARIVVESQEGTTSLPTPSADDQITTKLNMVMRTAIMLKYRTGDLVAGLRLNNTDAIRTDSTIDVMVDMTNTGNVSYLGILTCRLLDADDREINSHALQLAVYYDLKRRVSFPLPAGEFKSPYKVDVSISSRGRRDIPAKDMIYGNELSYTISMAD